MLYITLLDQFHPGIYSSQVIDVCDHLNKNHKANIQLVAFLSLRELLRTDARKRLKDLSPNAIVLPAFPKLRYFEWTAILLFFVCLFTGRRKAICRNVFCTNMAFKVKKTGLLKKVILDGRSAMAAEIKEYDVFPVDYIRNNVSLFEKKAVVEADYRIAVSNALINYWRREYNYLENNHVIIPCTLDNKYFGSNFVFSSDKTQVLRNQMGISKNDVLFVYSGSTAPWQSFELMEQFLSPCLAQNESIKVLFLSKMTKDIEKLQIEYPGRIIQKWIEHHEILDYLSCADYGLLLRENSVTNQVASPTKFGEYLFAGLNVLISPDLGDYTKFVIDNNCGLVISSESVKKFPQVLPEQKNANRKLAERHFTKHSQEVNSQYEKLLSALSQP
ncbi:MAG: hypothetical protein AB7O73_06095 [Bacteroidia bacterium]